MPMNAAAPPSSATGTRAVPMELLLLGYLLSYLPSIMLTRFMATTPIASLERPLTGLEILPGSLLLNLVMTYAFIWLSGWHRHARKVAIGRWFVPFPRRATFLSGMATSLILFTVPLSLTFKGVSIPFIQLVMRGDILILAPLVDILFGRRVRWWSWLALAMVSGALLITLSDRGGLNLPPLAILTVALYTLGYFLRLIVMTRVGKSGDPETVRAYFVEEKIIALPMSLAVLAAISGLGLGGQADELGRGFVGIWQLGVLPQLLGMGVTLTAVSILSILILLDPRENSYCVPLERAASLIAGVVAAILLAWGWGMPFPRAAELIGAGILIAAIALLSVAPRISARRSLPASVDHGLKKDS